MVSIEQVAGSARTTWSRGEMDGQAGHPCRPELGILQLDHRADHSSMVGGDPFGRGARPADCRAGPIPELLPFAGGAGEEQLAQPGMELLVDGLIAQAHHIQQRRAPVSDAGRLREPDEVAWAGCVELDVLAIFAAVGAGAATVDAAWRVQSALRDVRTRVTDEREHGVKEGRLHPLAAAGPLPRDKGHDDTRSCAERS